MIYASSQVQLRLGKEVSPCQIVAWSNAYIVVVHKLGFNGNQTVPNFKVFYPNGKAVRKQFKWTLEVCGIVQHDSGDEA